MIYESWIFLFWRNSGLPRASGWSPRQQKRSWVDWPWWVSISLPGNGQVSVAWSVNPSVWVRHKTVIQKRPAKVFREFWESPRSQPQPGVMIISSHIFRAFQRSHVWLPKPGFVCHGLVEAQHIKMILERHFVRFFVLEKAKLNTDGY